MKKTLLIFVILLLGFIILVPWFISFLNLEYNIYSVIIGYFGSILGGLLTLMGVYITIKHSSKEKNQELELQYFPVLLLDIVKYGNYIGEQKELIFLFNDFNFNDTDLDFGNYLIKISNVGRGEIRNLIMKTKKVEIISSSILIDSNNISFYTLDLQPIQFIPINGNIYCHIGMPKLVTNLEQNSKFSIMFNIILDLDFVGIFNKKDYKYELNFCLQLSKAKNEKYKYDIYSTHLHLK